MRGVIMRCMTSPLRLWLVVSFISFTSLAHAVPIFDTGLQQPAFGWVGYDIFPDQSVGVAFKPDFDCTLDRVGIWAMSNDFDNPGRTYTLKLVTDAGAAPSIPNVSNVIESWSMSTSAVGWTPVLDQANSVLHPVLSANTWYWLVAESTEPAGFDPLWTFAGNNVEYYSAINNAANPNGWKGGWGFGSTPATIIEATPVPEPTLFGLMVITTIISLRRRRAA